MSGDVTDIRYFIVQAPVLRLNRRGGSDAPFVRWNDLQILINIYSNHNVLHFILESTMNCSTLVGADNIVMDRQNYTNQCELRYRGGFAPKLTWSGPEPFRGPIEIVTDTDVFSGIGYTVGLHYRYNLVR